MKRDLTRGSIFKNIILFSLPYLLSFFLQTFYGMVDLYIVGQFNGTAAVDAVSIGSQFMHLVTVMIIGLSVGSTIAIGRFTGAGDSRRVSEIIGNTVTLFAAVAAVVTALLLIFRINIVSILTTPPEAVGDCITYLTLCFAGIPFIVAYNIISAVFRGLGDTRRPLYFVAAACVCNMVLDLIFIGALGMGTAGAALGTILAQAISVIISLVYIKIYRPFTVRAADLYPKGNSMRGILRNGLPITFQDGFIQVSFLVITVIANMRGLIDSTAVGIVEKLIGMYFLVPSSMLSAVSVIGAHNIGAGKPERAKEALKYALFIAWGYGILMVVLMQFAAEGAVGLFSKDPEVIRLGAEYMHGYIWDTVVAGTHFCFSGYFCAIEKANLSFLHNVISVVFGRIPFAYAASKLFPYTLFPMGLAITSGSMISVVVCVIAFIILDRRGIPNGPPI